ncbi:uncharacterized protein FIBRA_04435 [Fibroporia radiculosa]|uniref:NADP-dependent oxidoreductase domain-containing protein n=1 Tax=Fibroporia radiculosa TaxID=599839 RepID=J4IA59_9APHY|nr:uncharacterized protein FIBRA_04435 [Fibroporia radiculosa]CCM02341.1 predicted protein [Fibroporia radiculosa]
MTWRDPKYPLPDEDAFEAIKAGVDALPPGSKMLLNSGEFYSWDFTTANLQLLARFFDKYPDYAERTFLSVKGGAPANSLGLDSSPENLRRSVDAINAALRGTKKLDLFECARVDPKYPVEEVIKILVGLKNEGKFSHIGMSECAAETLRRGHAVHPIAIVEIEVSLWSYESETKKVIATAQELGIAVAAYSASTISLASRLPLADGSILIRSPTENDIRRHLTRFKEDYFKHNMAIVDAIKVLAAKKNISPAQLAIAWVGSLGAHVIPLPGSSVKKRTLENLSGGDVELSEADKAELAKIIADHEIKGDRYFGNDAAAHLWG